jgi:NTP pyrophosphatase (non-canonical NTP hydrolase)
MPLGGPDIYPGIAGCSYPACQGTDLARIAAKLQADLALNRGPDSRITDENQLDVQALCVAEEAGELVGAYRRWAGKARRRGTFEEVRLEVADVLIVTAVFAARAKVDIDQALADKLKIIYSRGWREPPAGGYTGSPKDGAMQHEGDEGPQEGAQVRA